MELASSREGILRLCASDRRRRATNEIQCGAKSYLVCKTRHVMSSDCRVAPTNSSTLFIS